MGEKNNIFKITTIILIIVLIIALGYIIFGKYQDSQDQKMQTVYVAGYNQGVTDSVIRIMQQTDNCQVTNVFANNVTRQIADAACIQQAIQAQQG